MNGKSPQEKKRLSYAKDRRNDYGENDKSSRKSIRFNKRAPHRADRRRASQVLDGATGATGAVGEVAAETAEQRLLVKRPKTWRKSPDAPLGEVVQYGLRRRMKFAAHGRVRRRLRLGSS